MLVLHVGPRPFWPVDAAHPAIDRSIRSEHVTHGLEAMELLRLYDYDIVLTRLDLPDISGIDLIRRVRLAGKRAPMLLADMDVAGSDRVRALDLGADDVLALPCDLPELLARVRAIVRRGQGHIRSVLHLGPVELSLDSHEVRVDGTPLHLSPREYAVLELLFLKKGVTLRKDAFLNHLYCGTEEPEMKTIDVIICRLRKKLAAAGVGQLIGTVWGCGYILRDPGPVKPVPGPVASWNGAGGGIAIAAA